MAGPTPMALGPYAFEGHGFGFDGISSKLNTEWSQIKLAGAYDAQQWLGPGHEEVTIKGVIFDESFGGLGSLKGIRGAAVAGIPLMMVSLGGNILGNMAVQSVTEEQSFIDHLGRPRKDAYSIVMKRYDGQVGNALSVLIGLF